MNTRSTYENAQKRT